MNSEHEADILIKKYINIANAALSKQKTDPLLQSMVNLLQTSFAVENLSLTVTDNTERPISSYTTRFINGQFTPVKQGVHHVDKSFTVKQSYLQEIVDHADHYLKHPARLNWDWINGQIKPVKHL